jgi:hypothetical protein
VSVFLHKPVSVFVLKMSMFLSLNNYRSMDGAFVAHMALLQGDLGSILTQTQMLLSDLSSPFLQTTDLKTITLICNTVMSS